MDLKATLISSDEIFGRLVDAIGADDWTKPTPDTDWNVRDLVNHLVGEELWLPETLGGKTIAEVGDKYNGDVVGSDPKAAWIKAAKLGREAIEKCDPDDIVHLSFGDFPASEYLGQMLIDRVIHSWDLARGLGADPNLKADLVQVAFDLLAPQAEAWRSGGAFGPRVTVPDSADLLTKLLAISGRKA